MPAHFYVSIAQAPEELRVQIAAQLGPVLADNGEHSEESTLFLFCPKDGEDLSALPPGPARLAVAQSSRAGNLADAMVSGLVHGWITPEHIATNLMRTCVATWERFQSQSKRENRPHGRAPTHSDDRALLGLMVNSMADGLIMTERKRAEVLVNPAARELLAIDAEVEVTRSYLQERLGFYPFDLVAANPESSVLLREELSIGERRLHSIVSPVRDHDGTLIGVVVVLRDFTESHSLAHRQEEFVSIVSHELRSPLTSISGALDIALSDYAGRLNDKQRQYLTLARESCSALNHVVDDLLDVARPDSASLTVHFGPVDLSELTSLAVSQYRGSAEAKMIDLKLTCGAGDLRIAGDPDRLTQVLNNLLSNAVKFTPRGGTIEVEAFGPSVSSTHVGVSVYNNGAAIAEEAKERIFDKFEQVRNSSTRLVGGSGLGLAISRSIIEAHGGRIWVEPRNEGAKFVFTLPATLENSPPPPPAAGEFDGTHEIVAKSGKSVLLVDAEPHSSLILKGILMSLGHEVAVASDPDAGLAIARTGHPVLIVVHASPSHWDPHALLEILKHDADTRQGSVLVLGHGDLSDLRLACSSVIPLPVDPQAFHKECGRLIEESVAESGNRVLVVDDDPAIRTICAEVMRQAGMSVRVVGDGLIAVTEARKFRPDLIILDVMMPEQDGFETAAQLKADATTALTPIIFLSALGETSDKIKAFNVGAEDYIQKPFVAAELVARARKALDRSDRDLGASPTTQLPGGGAIEAEFTTRLCDPKAAFCYLDLDNLKAYNDYYSYAKADSIIRQTGTLIRDVLLQVGNHDDFIGHIAGDDFVFATTVEKVDEFCIALCSAFDRLVPLYYDRKDRDAGFIETKDRYDEMRRFPLMSVSIAAITNAETSLVTYSQLATASATGKNLAKAVPGSCYIRDEELIWQARS
ncbi:MAG: response regulator [Myxococcales bacterium]|nr:response regulator [Myxococcales bacterium]